MPLSTIIGVLVFTGIALWLFNRLIPLSPSIKKILNAVVLLAVFVWLLRVLGILVS